MRKAYEEFSQEVYDLAHEWGERVTRPPWDGPIVNAYITVDDKVGVMYEGTPVAVLPPGGVLTVYSTASAPADERLVVWRAIECLRRYQEKVGEGEKMTDYAKRIEELEQELAKLKEDLAEQEMKTEEAPPVWVPEMNEDYHFINKYVVGKYDWGDDLIDNRLFEIGNAFKTAKEAKDHLRYLKLKETMRRERKRANGDWEWRKGEFYYSILNENNRVKGWHLCWSDIPSEFGKWQCREKLNEVIERHREELEWFFNEYLPSVD